ncbi:nucleolar DEAD-box protein required for synthesis of 60S ribosomal subunit [Coniosporium uncinatum]|uniref:Nucleolar DEAD-box protein required for synthesis of 60S ribosomal subunit n=1 Tax=Coniosporium uncinatum TaxID=93489 RepID=A0ACC3E081_9PEZI|nr:nucleolar DEAD-box protein required for synthesis of 60S ribosomal subunit [Coniosporium uncinatum]
MAPIMDDDFVLTLSDAEGPIQEEELQDAAPREQRNKKRKREEVKQKGKSKAKKLKKAPEQEEREDEQEDHDRTWADQGEYDGALDSDFEFQVGDVDTGVLEDFDGWGLGSKSSTGQNGEKKGVDIDEIIARRRGTKSEKAETNGHTENVENGAADDEFAGFEENDETLAEDAFGMGASVDAHDDEDEDQSAEQDSDEEHEINGGGDNSDDESVAYPLPHPEDLGAQATEDEDEDEAEDPLEAERRAAFFAPEENIDGHKPPATKGSGSFQNMSLSRPILKGLAAVGFTEPTPIQSKTVPVALLGKDVVGGAVTGSGKTAAFIIPILERLLYRPKKVPTTRVAVLMPTRELAVQCFNVAKKLAAFTDITFAQIVGGFSLREQENVLKQRPDVIIATPGRFIDHMRNSPSFAVDTLEILVLDEADRMLEDGFADELNEILTTIPKSRQTMLFSATMTDTVDKLIRVGLNRPVRLLVDAKKQTVAGLVQEFVRLRPGREDKRLAYLLHLCEKVYTTRVIVFFRQKKEAHRVRVVFGLCGLKAAELHGSMTQEQRISAVEAFRSGKASFLLATDLASRGLDIKGVDSVINYEAPQSHEIYLHRVGRTARAGRSGNACTLAAEPDRRVVKAAVKSARAQGAKIVSRTVPNEAADAWAEKLTAMVDEIEEVLKEEKEERALSQVEREVKRGENIIDHETEIMSRPKRTWFESEKEKKISKDKGRAELNGMGVLGQREKRKLSNKEKKKLDVRDERKGGREWKKGKEERMGKGALEKSKGPKSKSKPKVKGGKPKGRPSKGRR